MTSESSLAFTLEKLGIIVRCWEAFRGSEATPNKPLGF